MTNYFSVGGGEDDTESVAPAPAPAPTPAAVKFAETSDTEDTDDESTDSEPPKIQLTEEAVNLEGIDDLDEKEEVVDIQVPESSEGESLVLKL